MNYAEIKYNDIANGPGVRTSFCKQDVHTTAKAALMKLRGILTMVHLLLMQPYLISLFNEARLYCWSYTAWRRTI